MLRMTFTSQISILCLRSCLLITAFFTETSLPHFISVLLNVVLRVTRCIMAHVFILTCYLLPGIISNYHNNPVSRLSIFSQEEGNEAWKREEIA